VVIIGWDVGGKAMVMPLPEINPPGLAENSPGFVRITIIMNGQSLGQHLILCLRMHMTGREQTILHQGTLIFRGKKLRLAWAAGDHIHVD